MEHSAIIFSVGPCKVAGGDPGVSRCVGVKKVGTGGTGNPEAGLTPEKRRTRPPSLPFQPLPSPPKVSPCCDTPLLFPERKFQEFECPHFISLHSIEV